MDRNTRAALGDLRIGDRFHLPGKNEIWQVRRHDRKFSAVNIPGTLKDTFLLKHDEQRNKATIVIFMRHTSPLPGESCYFSDLKIGDVFNLPDNVIREYLLTASGVEGVNTLSMESARALQGTDRVFFVRTEN